MKQNFLVMFFSTKKQGLVSTNRKERQRHRIRPNTSSTTNSYSSHTASSLKEPIKEPVKRKSTFGFVNIGTPLYDSGDDSDGDEMKKEWRIAFNDRSRTGKEKRAAQINARDGFVLDEQGRRRFHGAFTGGFSAGYYNTCGSADGWAPATFKSSRKDKLRKQNDDKLKSNEDGNSSWKSYDERVSSIGDEEDMKDFSEKTFQTRAGYGLETHLQKSTARTNDQPPSDISETSSIPLFSFNSITQIVTKNASIGARLLKRMGWHEGRGIGAKSSFNDSEPTNLTNEDNVLQPNDTNV